MNYVLTFQDFAIAISFTLAFILILSRNHSDHRPYFKAKWYLLSALTLLTGQFTIQRFGMLRLQENYSVALFVNIAIFMPVAFMIINSMHILLTNRNIPRKIQTASFGLYLIGIAACIYYRCTRSDEWAVKVICALCFMLHLVMLFLTNMKAYYKLGVWVKLRGFLSMLCLYRSNCVVNFVLFNLAFCGLLYNFAPQSEA